MTFAFARVLAVVPLPVAQDPPPIGRGIEVQLLPEVTSRLGSENLATIAWGAHLAAKHRVAAAVPDVQRALARLAATVSAPQAERNQVAAALFDALVQNDAKVTADELAPFVAGTTRGAAYLLLAPAGKANAACFRAEYERFADDSKQRAPWLAAGNLLASWRDPHLSTRILDRIEYRLHALVTDPGAAVRGGSGSGSTTAADLSVLEHFPPAIVYELVTQPRTGDVLLVDTEPLHVRRASGNGAGKRDAEPLASHTRQATRLRWLADVLRAQPGERGDSTPSETFAWRDAATLRADIARTKDELAKQFTSLQERSRTGGFDLATGLRPTKVRTRLHDVRKESRDPLPAID